MKDKKFTSYDLEHAFKKIQEQGGSKGQFIYGPSATFDEELLEKRISVFEQEGFMVLFQDIFTYSRTMIFKIDLNSKQEFIDTIMSRITLPGSIFLAFVAILPAFATKAGINAQFAHFYGGTSLLILVGVVLDTLQQIESHLLMRHYDGLMKTGRIKGRAVAGAAV